MFRVTERRCTLMGLALACGITGCSAGSGQDQQSGVPGTGGAVAAPSASGVNTPPPAIGAGSTPATTPPPTGYAGVPAGAGGTTPILNGSGGVAQIIGAGGTTPVGGGGVPLGSGGTSVIIAGSGGAAPGAGGAAAPGTGGASGGNSNGVGCGQGTFCQPGDDLAPPATSDGFQIVSPASLMVNPGDEQFWCYFKTIPGTGEVDVGGFRSWMTVGASHHFITFHTTAGGADGSLVACPFGSGDWVYATSKAGMIIGMDIPPGVGLPFQAGSQLIMNMHLINTGDAPVKPVVKLNVLYAKNVMQKAASVFSLLANAQISVPPGGSQTVRGSCSVPAGSNFFLWTTHSHKFTTEDNVDYVSGGQTTNIVHTTDWENPGTHIWTAPNFLTTKAGDSFNYSCSYKNTLPMTLTFGETAAYNEMCLAIGYYFPAGVAACL